MGTLPATRSQQGCWKIGAGAGSQMGTAGSQNSGGSQQGCWEPTESKNEVGYTNQGIGDICVNYL